jgi:hypothetical protein
MKEVDGDIKITKEDYQTHKNIAENSIITSQEEGETSYNNTNEDKQKYTNKLLKYSD